MTALLAVLMIGTAAAVLGETAVRRIRGRQVNYRALEQLGLRERPSNELAPARLDLRVRRLIGAGTAIALVGTLVMGPLALAFAGLPWFVDRLLRQRADGQRVRSLATSLAPTLQLLVDNLRVGRDLVTAMAEVAGAVDEPMRSMFDSIVAETRLGVRVDWAFARVVAQEHDRHLDVVSSGIALHAEHGGNLVEILSTVIETVEEEDRLRRDLASLTADGRLSSQVLLGLPVVTLLGVSVLSPGYAAPLVDTSAGRMVSAVGAVLGFVGWWWLRALTTTDVVG